MLHCPRCRSALAQTNDKIGTVYECSHCLGKAITLPVLRRTILPDSIREIWAQTFSEEHPVNLHCPACHRSMVEVTVASRIDTDLQLDVCKTCHFLWFDPSELDHMHPKPPPEPTLDERLPQKAKELLALKKIEQIRDEEFGDAPTETWQWLPAALGLPVEQGGKLHHTRPWITWLIAGLCVVVAILTWKDPDSAFRQFGLIPSDMLRMNGLTLITSFFLHGGIWHLVGNLYFLLIFGDNVEAALGRWRYLLLLFFATVAGGLLHGYFNPGSIQSSTPLIGASGGISGIIVFYALMFPKARLGFIASLHVLYRWFVIPAWLALIVWAGFQIYGVVTQLAGFSNVSALAHLGGAAVGFAFWILVRLRLAVFDFRAERTAAQ